MPASRLARLVAARPATAIVIALAVGAAAAGAWYVLFRPSNPGDAGPSGVRRESVPPDPREVFATPFRNVKPGVAYVGDAACAGCHRDIVKRYHAHPMGRSAEFVDRAAPLERYGADAKNPFTAVGFEFKVEQVGKKVVHRLSARPSRGERLPDYEMPMDVAIGSGTRGRTYLSIQGDAVWQSPVSWFSGTAGTERWDLSPNHVLDQGGRRPIIPECLYCHTHRVEAVPGAENRFRQPLFAGQVSIGCERCHGPGELHVAGRRAGREPERIDYSIVNPTHLPDDLRTDVCRQCHLQGVERVTRRGRDVFEYRPGLPWEQFVSTFVLRPDMADYRRSVGQFEQMGLSRCFTGSGGKLTCVGCHDPHHKPLGKEADQFYRSRCLSCHETKGCSAPTAERQVKADSCVACHMPRGDSSNIAHASVTDHRVPRRPGDVSRPAAPQGAGLPLVPYPPGPHAPPAEERDRDWGMAAGAVVIAVPRESWLGLLAMEKLTNAVRRWPGDSRAWLTLATLRSTAGRNSEALAAARTAAALEPDSEEILVRVAVEGRLARAFDVALPAADALVKMSPTYVQHRLTRAEIHIDRKDWAKAEADIQAALQIHPLHWKARLYLAVCHHHQGQAGQAREEAAVAAELIPSERLRTTYMNWFAEQVR